MPEIVNPTPIATLFYGRKVGLPAYGNEEFSTFLQVPLDGIAGSKELEALLDEQSAFLKAFVLKQLSVSFIVDPQSGVVVGDMPVEQPKNSRKTTKRSSGTTAKAAANTDKEELWASLAGAEPNGQNWKTQQGETVWDNRENKRNPNAPDFKFADSNEGLWLDSAPAWYSGPGEGMTI